MNMHRSFMSLFAACQSFVVLFCENKSVRKLVRESDTRFLCRCSGCCHDIVVFALCVCVCVCLCVCVCACVCVCVCVCVQLMKACLVGVTVHLGECGRLFD
ncbi:hypothetical protein JOB18_037592 [Solea senegalensis]|uniref:Secreted protein n=1 Tax=Solea senegalensis TaxID=28829 RepID=A0AAV6SMB0_SOLSE|nr:hypothetical protein JOB18_037592 [Solea senegalensis]